MSEENDTELGEDANQDIGIPDDTPDEIRDFVMRNDVADKYTVMLKRKPEGGGTAGTLRNFTNYHPNVNRIGKEWGPGDYELVFSWRGAGISGKKETITKGFKLVLPYEAWQEPHEDYLAQKAKERRKKEEAEWESQAAKIRAQGGIVGAQPQAAPPSELDVIKKALDTARSLGIPIGGKVSEKPVEKKSFAQTMVDMAPAITAIGAIVGPIATALITRQRPPEDKTLLNTLVTHMLVNKPQENDVMKNVVPFLMGTFKQMMEIKQEIMEPEEKQSWVEKIFDKLAPVIPMVIEAASRPNAAQNPMLKMAAAHPDMQKLREDTDAQTIAIEKLDREYGFQNANDLLGVMGLARPPHLMENWKQFPSKGWRKDGTHENDPPAGGDGRDARLPDDKGTPDTGEDGVVG